MIISYNAGKCKGVSLQCPTKVVLLCASRTVWWQEKPASRRSRAEASHPESRDCHDRKRLLPIAPHGPARQPDVGHQTGREPRPAGRARRTRHHSSGTGVPAADHAEREAHPDCLTRLQRPAASERALHGRARPVHTQPPNPTQLSALPPVEGEPSHALNHAVGSASAASARPAR